MKRHVQAAMRSGLIFPGAGQLFLGRRWRALAFAAPTLVAAISFFNDIMVPVQVVANELMFEMFDGRMPDIGTLMGRVHQISLGAATAGNPAVYAIVGLWAVSIIDAWLLGR